MRHTFIAIGTVEKMGELQEFANSSKQQIHLLAEKTGEYENERDEWFAIDFWGDKGQEMLLDITEGDRVEVTIRATGNQYKDRVFNNYNGQKIEKR